MKGSRNKIININMTPTFLIFFLLFIKISLLNTTIDEFFNICITYKNSML